MKKIVLTKSVDFLFSQIKPKDFKAFVEHLLWFWVPGRAVIACNFHYFLQYSKLLLSICFRFGSPDAPSSLAFFIIFCGIQSFCGA